MSDIKKIRTLLHDPDVPRPRRVAASARLTEQVLACVYYKRDELLLLIVENLEGDMYPVAISGMQAEQAAIYVGAHAGQAHCRLPASNELGRRFEKYNQVAITGLNTAAPAIHDDPDIRKQS